MENKLNIQLQLLHECNSRIFLIFIVNAHLHIMFKVTGSLPVLFYIHGGGFAEGSALSRNQRPDYFMETKKVVMVFIQYRLGALGESAQMVIYNPLI